MNINSLLVVLFIRVVRWLSVVVLSNILLLFFQVFFIVFIGDVFDLFWNFLVRNVWLSNVIYQKIKVDFYVCVGVFEQ